MKKFDMAFSLNRQINITADNYNEAEKQLKAKLESEGIDGSKYELDVYDVNEEDIDEDDEDTDV